MKFAFALVAIVAPFVGASCSSTAAGKPESRAPLLDAAGKIAADAPTVMVGGSAIRTAEHRVALRAGCLVSVELSSEAEWSEFDPLLEVRPLDGRPTETRRSNSAADSGRSARLELLPERDGEWSLLVGDARGRAGSYRLRVRRIFEREVFVAHGEVQPSVSGLEAPVSLFCPVREGRRYRVDVAANGFPPHLVAAAPGVATTECNDASLEFVAARSGHAVVQVASLSLASGPFEVRVLELW